MFSEKHEVCSWLNLWVDYDCDPYAEDVVARKFGTEMNLFTQKCIFNYCGRRASMGVRIYFSRI